MLNLLGQIGMGTTPAGPTTTSAMHFTLHEWMPNSAELVRGLGVAGGILIVGLVIFGLFRKYIVRARLSLTLFILFIALAVYLGVGAANPERLFDQQDSLRYWLIRLFNACLLFVAISLANRAALVPLLTRGGRLPLPRFLQQIILTVVVIFAVLGYGSYAFGWEIDKFLAGSAVVSIVLGLALQETLGSFFSGLVMQTSSPFVRGDWITCAGVEGRVVDMTWRAVTLQTNDDNFVHIPNSVIAKEQIVNFNAPTSATARSVRIGLEYGLSPTEAIAVLKAAALETPGVAAQPEPFVYLDNYADSAIVYRIKFWITDPSNYPKLEHQVRLNAWFRLRQKGCNIPFPIRTVEYASLEKKNQRVLQAAAAERLHAIQGVPLLAALSEQEKQVLVQSAADLLLAPGQTLFRQDDPGDSFYVIRHGTVEVLVRHGHGEHRLATLGPGEYFGEMSALTGQPRSATIRAVTPLACVEIHKQELHALFAVNPTIMEAISLAIARRNAEQQTALQSASAAAQSSAVTVQQKSVLDRMLWFFGFRSR